MMDYYKKLGDFATKLAADLSYEGDEGEPGLVVVFKKPIHSNYPWLYLEFEVTGVLCLYHIKMIELKVLTFIQEHGGALETIRFLGINDEYRMNFILKMIYAGG